MLAARRVVFVVSVALVLGALPALADEQEDKGPQPLAPWLLPKSLPDGYVAPALPKDAKELPFEGLVKNPQDSTEREFIEGLARGMGVSADDATQALFALYRGGESKRNEVGVFALGFSSKAAMEAAAEKLRKSGDADRFVIATGRKHVLAMVWRDPGASKAAFDALTKHVKSVLARE